MSKARKRHLQPYWKRAHTGRQRAKSWLRRIRSGEIQIVRFDDVMREIYPKEIGS